ncbi:MAG: TonB-dependent receptor [Methylotenera sp.]|nr:TonB-dependent receptor [Methylotenera sp.]MDP3943188.1 TonB-dependent receptor [Methylotenera sp.]
MRFKKRVIASLLPLVFAHLAYAADQQSIELKAVTVTGILPDRLEAVPGSFSVVDEKELEVRRPFSIKEALSGVPGLNIIQNEDPLGLAQNIGLRGMPPRRSARTLLMEDGMPLFLAPYGDPASHYLPMLDRVQRIEVVKGSGQILYGPQTVGGMINFVTKPVPKNGFASSVTGTVGNNDFTGINANVGYGNEQGGIMLDVTEKRGDGIRDNHEFEVLDVSLKGQLNLTERQTLIAKVGYYNEDSNVSETQLGAVDYARDKFQAPSGNNDRFEHERKSLQLQHIFDLNDSARLTTQAYYVDAYRNSFRQTNTPGGYNDELAGQSTGVTRLERCPAGLNAATEANAEQCGGRHRPRSYNYYGFEPRLDFKHNLFGIKSDAVIGFRYHQEDITRQQYRGSDARAQSLSFLKANAEQLGITSTVADFREDIRIDAEAKSYYVQNTFNVGNWAVTPGLRLEDISIKTKINQASGNVANNKLTNNQTELLPGLGVAWNGIANTTIFSGVHKGFAPPRPDRDIDGAAISKTNPEESTNFELGIRSAYFKGVTFESTLFHTKFENLVVAIGSGRNTNGGEAAMSGLELAGRVDFGKIYDSAHNFYVMANYTNLFNAEFKKTSSNSIRDGILDGERLAYAPEHMASINFGYQHPIGIDARIGADYISKQESDTAFRSYVNNTVFNSVDAALSGLSGDIPAYTLFNASVNFKPVGSKATYFLSGHNLADREYLASRVDGMSAGRGRQVFGGIRYDF